MTSPDGSAPSPIPSSTVLMLRDAPGGVNVFLLKRHGQSDAFGNVHVFPGGKMDSQDFEIVDRLDQPLSALHDALGEPELSEPHAGALYVAAIREAFEETGVLYASSPDQAAVDATLSSGARHLAGVLDMPHVRLATTCLAPWSRWITPANSLNTRKRFDVRFFVAAVPQGQEPVHDRHETTEGVWLAPEAALRAFLAGRIQLVPPQIMSLAHLSRYPDVGSVLAEARRRKPFCIRPEAFEDEGGTQVCYPGDERHPQSMRAMPGPLRLRWRHGRFEPDGGIEALLG